MQKKRILVACEFSGRVRDAFIARGHDAISCDFLPTERPGPHFVGDVRQILARKKFDLLIAHPPCTFLANSGVRWLYENGRGIVKNKKRWPKMVLAVVFFRELLESRIDEVAVENPIMHKYAADLLGIPWTQTIQPWQFGHGECKRTCLWLKNLPPLIPTKIASGRNQTVAHEPPAPDRWKKRSRTFHGIAAAMAEQWG